VRGFTRSTCLGGRRAELRFTVRRLPCGEVSLCWYRPSGGDVAGCVHVGVAPPGFAGDAGEDRLALAVFGCDVPAGRAALRRLRGTNPFDPSRGFMVEPGDQPAPPCCLIARLSPRFWATRKPGWSSVPRAELVIAHTSRSSTRIVSKRRARSVVVACEALLEPAQPNPLTWCQAGGAQQFPG
jgi:hypothetical protein